MSTERLTKSKCPHQEFVDGRCVCCGGKQRENLVGQTFNGLTVKEMLPKGRVRFECFCGRLHEANANKIKHGWTLSCGCYFNVGKRLKHGHTRGPRTSEWRTPTYRTWIMMHGRCRNKNDKDHYPDYGGRGIKVCERWSGEDGFANFLADMGERPEGKTLDRFPNGNGDYEPGNCRWATRKEQQRNRRNNTILTCDGVSKCLAQWADDTGVSAVTITWRLQNGWPIEKALGTPARRGNNGSRLKTHRVG